MSARGEAVLTCDAALARTTQAGVDQRGSILHGRRLLGDEGARRIRTDELAPLPVVEFFVHHRRATRGAVRRDRNLDADDLFFRAGGLHDDVALRIDHGGEHGGGVGRRLAPIAVGPVATQALRIVGQISVVDHHRPVAIVQARTLHVGHAVAPGRYTQHEFGALHAVGSVELGLELHRGGGDVADRCPGNGDDAIPAVHLHVAIEHVEDGGGHQFHVAEGTHDVTGLPLHIDDLTVGSQDDDGQHEMVRPVAIDDIGAERHVAAVLTCLGGDRLHFGTGHFDAELLHRATRPAERETRQRQFVEHDEIVSALGLSPVEPFEHVREVRAQHGLRIGGIGQADARLHQCCTQRLQSKRRIFGHRRARLAGAGESRRNRQAHRALDPIASIHAVVLQIWSAPIVTASAPAHDRKPDQNSAPYRCHGAAGWRRALRRAPAASGTAARAAWRAPPSLDRRAAPRPPRPAVHPRRAGCRRGARAWCSGAGSQSVLRRR